MTARRRRSVWWAGLMGASLTWGLAPDLHGQTSRDTIDWSITFDDADTWVQPWTFGMRLTRDDRQPVFEYACHEGNEGMRGMLSAARAEEREARPAPPPR